MPDIIRLLPDSVANQIAAGEVIQRPASVVKELMENAIDAQSSIIKVIIKDAGKTTIQVIDDGCGMSETDARMCFERHATSKISDASDLFNIRTMGFRGEALPSIAAIATVELKTKRENDETGIHLEITASQLQYQQPIACQKGSCFTVKNLFFNVPARRKFLKNDSLEFKHIITEFQRIALSNPNVAMCLYNNDTEIFNLPASNIKQRIINIFGKNYNQCLLPVNSDASIFKLTGFIGTPDSAKKQANEQYFFVNNRYMRHPYFHRAVLNAYEKIIPSDYLPSYFLYFSIDPKFIDINIHPTKTEIKFEDERTIFQLLYTIIKQTIGKNNLTPSIDFNTEACFNIPSPSKDTPIINPEITTNAKYNPFDIEKSNYPRNNKKSYDKNIAYWEKLFEDLEKEKDTDPAEIDTENIPKQTEIFTDDTSNSRVDNTLLQYKSKYIVLSVKSGLMIIDRYRAHERILFENYMHTLINQQGISQQNLYPSIIDITSEQMCILESIIDEIRTLGFDIQILGKNTLVINGTPSNLSNSSPSELLEHLLHYYQTCEGELKKLIHERIAQSLAKAGAATNKRQLSVIEMQELVDMLFACSIPNFTAEGKPIITVIEHQEIEKKFK